MLSETWLWSGISTTLLSIQLLLGCIVNANFKESVLGLPVHLTTWLNTGDGDFVRKCFRERLLNVQPDFLSLVLVPVNMNDMHWGLMFKVKKPSLMMALDGAPPKCPMSFKP